MADPSRQYLLLRDEINTALDRLLSSGQYIGGGQVALFEQELAHCLGIPDRGVVSCGNGTDALELAYRVAELKAGDEVIMPSFNYVASAEAALRLGLVPVWADVNEHGTQMYNIDTRAEALEPLLSERTRAIVGVNLYGHAVDAPALRAFADAHGLVFIEDNAQGLGGQTAQGVSLGTLGDIATVSFFPTKPLGCMGDGGALITRHRHWAERVRALANHGQYHKYSYQYVGMNSRLDALQASILRIKLQYLDSFVASTRQIARYYIDQLSRLEGFLMPHVCLLTTSTFHQFTCLLPEHIDRDRLIKYFLEHDIQLQLYYPEPLHLTNLYASLGVQRVALKSTEHLSRRMLSLPIYPLMTTDEAERVVEVLRCAFEQDGV